MKLINLLLSSLAGLFLLVVVHLDILDGEPKRERMVGSEVVIFVPDVDLFDVELHSSEDARDQAEKRWLLELLRLFLLSLLFCIQLRIGSSLCIFSFFLLPDGLPPFRSVLLPLLLGVELLLPHLVYEGLPHPFYCLVHQGDIV